MSIIDTLITDRSAADRSELQSLLTTPFDRWTAEQKEQFGLAVSKGAYNASDLNRVNDACDYLASRLRGYGYCVNVKRPVIKETIVTPGTSVLPAGYTELDYIESTGTQRIDTNFYPNQDTRVVMDMNVLSTNTSDKDHYLSAANVGAGYWTMRLKSNLSGYAARYPGASLSNVAHSGDIFARHIFDQNRNVVQIDDATPTAFTASTWSSPRTLPIFCYRSSDSNYSGYINAQLYSCKIYDNDTLVRDYVPCIAPDGEVGLYDIVNSVFYGNAGSGTFVAGPKIVKLPEGYKQVEYIESSGTQYIDTEITLTTENYSALRVMAEMEVDPDGTSEWALIGASDDDTTNSRFYLGTNRSGIIYYPVNTSDKSTGVTYTGGKCVWEIDSANGTLRVGTFVSVSDVVVSAPTAKRNLFLFAYNCKDVAKCHIGKLYSCRGYDNGTLVRDYVPCLTSGGEAGLYDIANSVFYGNAGTGVFTAGEEVSGRGSGSKAETITRNYWKIGDIPQRHHMEEYLQNVSVLRGAFRQAASTPFVPADMEHLTVQEANEIELILVNIQTLLNNVLAAWLYSGEIYSGEVI